VFSAFGLLPADHHFYVSFSKFRKGIHMEIPHEIPMLSSFSPRLRDPRDDEGDDDMEDEGDANMEDENADVLADAGDSIARDRARRDQLLTDLTGHLSTATAASKRAIATLADDPSVEDLDAAMESIKEIFGAKVYADSEQFSQVVYLLESTSLCGRGALASLECLALKLRLVASFPSSADSLIASATSSDIIAMAVKAVTAANKETTRKSHRKKFAAQAMVSESGDYELLGTVVNYMQESLPGLRPEVYEFSIQDIEANPWKACLPGRGTRLIGITADGISSIPFKGRLIGSDKADEIATGKAKTTGGYWSSSLIPHLLAQAKDFNADGIPRPFTPPDLNYSPCGGQNTMSIHSLKSSLRASHPYRADQAICIVCRPI
jgi:hypothetical protein